MPGWGNEELQYYSGDAHNLSVRDATPLFTKRYGKIDVMDIVGGVSFVP